MDIAASNRILTNTFRQGQRPTEAFGLTNPLQQLRSRLAQLRQVTSLFGKKKCPTGNLDRNGRVPGMPLSFCND